MDKCPLCMSFDTTEFSRDQKRIYYLCANCTLLFVPRKLLIQADEEKKRYSAHQNSADEPGYVAYLSKIADSLSPFLLPGDVGLDFGSGRTNLLSEIMAKKGLKMDSYDLYFNPDEEIWNRRYDFIMLSEVIEHLREPFETMQKIGKILTEGGQLFIKTKFYPKTKERFDNWFYKRDMTHVQFFSNISMRYLGNALGLGNKFQMIDEDLYRISPSLTESTSISL